MASGKRQDSGRTRASLVLLGSVIVGLLWQPVLLDPKPAWYAFSPLKYANYLLFFAPFVIAYFLCRSAGSRGWLRGGLMLGIGYLLTLPYNAVVENAKMGSSTGFVMYHWGSWFHAIFGITTIFVGFFGVGAVIGHFAGKSGRPRNPRPAREEPATEALPAAQPQPAQPPMPSD